MKLPLALLIILSLGLPTYAEEETQEPQKAQVTINPPYWEEYCPLEFVDSKYMPVRNNRRDLGMILTILFPPIGIPVLLTAKDTHKAVENNYWVSRRPQFENAVQACKASSDIGACYNQIRQLEMMRSEMHDQNTQLSSIRHEVRRIRINQAMKNY
jgi:hypothetical protein